MEKSCNFIGYIFFYLNVFKYYLVIYLARANLQEHTRICVESYMVEYF